MIVRPSAGALCIIASLFAPMVIAYCDHTTEHDCLRDKTGSLFYICNWCHSAPFGQQCQEVWHDDAGHCAAGADDCVTCRSAVSNCMYDARCDEVPAHQGEWLS